VKRRLPSRHGSGGLSADSKSAPTSFSPTRQAVAIGLRVLAPADKADLTADLWVISLVYAAAPGKEFPDVASADKAGVKIGTIRGAPSDRVLTREITAAELVRIPLSPSLLAHFGRARSSLERPLVGVKQPSQRAIGWAVRDPKRKSPFSAIADIDF
jgi:hypothetical protein